MKEINKHKNLFKNIFFQNIILCNWLIAVITLVIIAIICIYFSYPETVICQIGDTSEKTIIAKSMISYRDYKTEKYIKEQIVNNTLAYDDVRNQLTETLSDISLIFNIINESRKNGNVTQNDVDKLRLKINPYINNRISDMTLYYLLSISEKDLNEIKDKSVYINSYILSKNLKDDSYHLNNAFKQARKILDLKWKNSNNNDITYEIIVNTLKPNQIYSDDKTKKLIEEKSKTIPKIYRTIFPGDVILSQGEKIDEYTLEILRNSGLFNNKILYIKNAIGIILLILFAFSYIFLFLKKFNFLLPDSRQILLFSVIILSCMLCFWLIGSMLTNVFDNYKMGYLAIMWIISCVMLIYNFISKYLSVFILAFLSLIIGFVFGNDIRIVSLSLITGMCALWAVSRITVRYEIINIYIVLALVIFIQVFISGFIYNDRMDLLFRQQIKYAVLTIPLSIVIYYIFSCFIERIFNLSTDMRLLELSNANNYILKSLILKAPGTYTHSVSVSYIAEAASEAIGAKTLVAKVGALYHDIGKLNNPDYYIENQYAENIHNDIKPQLSVMVIRSHVKLGTEYAKKYRLPKILIDCIEQHHGTSLVSYFYHKFSDNNTSLINVESQFRYEGPKPQTKEAAIIMIADSVEAASRSLKEPTPAKIETLVNSLVSDKLADGQFNECPLTLADISSIKISCIKSLLHVMHTRIEYPNKK